MAQDKLCCSLRSSPGLPLCPLKHARQGARVSPGTWARHLCGFQASFRQRQRPKCVSRAAFAILIGLGHRPALQTREHANTVLPSLPPGHPAPFLLDLKIFTCRCPAPHTSSLSIAAAVWPQPSVWPPGLCALAHARAGFLRGWAATASVAFLPPCGLRGLRSWMGREGELAAGPPDPAAPATPARHTCTARLGGTVWEGHTPHPGV